MVLFPAPDRNHRLFLVLILIVLVAHYVFPWNRKAALPAHQPGFRAVGDDKFLTSGHCKVKNHSERPAVHVAVYNCPDDGVTKRNDVPWIRDLVCNSGLSLTSFAHLHDDEVCGYSTDIAIACHRISKALHACGGTYYAGSKKVSYLPGFETLSTKTGLCTTTNKASVTRKVDFDVTPRCLVWEGNQSTADMFALSNKEGRDSWWVAKTNSLCCGMGISFLTTSDLDLLPSLHIL